MRGRFEIGRNQPPSFMWGWVNRKRTGDCHDDASRGRIARGQEIATPFGLAMTLRVGGEKKTSADEGAGFVFHILVWSFFQRKKIMASTNATIMSVNSAPMALKMRGKHQMPNWMMMVAMAAATAGDLAGLRNLKNTKLPAKMSNSQRMNPIVSLS